MLFSSSIFLFAFLPVVLTLYFFSRSVRWRNALLLLASLVFYAWGEFGYVLLLLLSIAANYAFGLWIDRSRGRSAQIRVLFTAVLANLSMLGFFKYANFVTDNLNLLLRTLGAPALELEPVHLPIGISFFTFQAITYVVDVYRRDADVQRNPLRVALYIALFPQLIAGPIVRYRSIATQLGNRVASGEDIAEGVRRFVIGLAKKVLIANTLAVPADQIFAVPPQELTASVAWLGALCFTLQIYFDFSGYSDMAIGLGRIFGFRFPENFRYPYVASSVREFWRRWHISLSTWFRDYVYIPLGGNRGSALRTLTNLFTVFLLCGLWHGASWNFVVWGLLHGCFLAAERTRVGDWLRTRWRPLQQVYTLAVVVLAWVFFRCETLPDAMGFLGTMAGVGAPQSAEFPLVAFLDAPVGLALAIGLVCATPRPSALGNRAREAFAPPVFALGRLALVNLLLFASAISLAAGTHNPFIYFRF